MVSPDELRKLAGECAMEEQTSNEAMMIDALRQAADALTVAVEALEWYGDAKRPFDHTIAATALARLRHP